MHQKTPHPFDSSSVERICAMKSIHASDGFWSSESAYLEAAQYWMHLLPASGTIPPRRRQVAGENRLLDGSCDTGGGVLLTLVNTSVLKVLRLSQSHKTEAAFLIAHLDKREVNGAECTQLSHLLQPQSANRRDYYIGTRMGKRRMHGSYYGCRIE